MGQEVNKKTGLVEGYTKKNGKKVASYFRTAPNKTKEDNLRR